jgi:transcriptional regulator with XRE-family HTH domain
MPKQPTNIRDLRESMNLSQDKVAAAAGVTYNVFVRIEECSGKTTPQEVSNVMTALKEMEPGTRKLAGRPFKDAAKEAAVRAARETGSSVSEALGIELIKPARKRAPAKKAAAKKDPANSMASALSKGRAKK